MSGTYTTDDMMSLCSTTDDKKSSVKVDAPGCFPANAASFSMETDTLAIHASQRSPSRGEMDAVFVMCRNNQWRSVLNSVRSCPQIAVTGMTMQNHITTTVLHQAITSKGDTKLRAQVVEAILDVTPEAAKIKNGYGSLPIHVIAQRNTKMNSTTKESLIRQLVNAFPKGLVEPGGVGCRTPVHIIFTDYISPALTEEMLSKGRKACFMRDSKGYLPIHIACSRHASPCKIAMLLDINAASLHSKTDEGESCLDLAVKTATKSHPNYALIDDLQKRLRSTGGMYYHDAPTRVSSNDGTCSTSEGSAASRPRGTVATTCSRKTVIRPRKRKRKVTADDDVKAMFEDDNEQANLLLSLSRQTHDIKNFASV